MPLLEVVSRSEAQVKTAGKARAEELRQYIEFIEGLTGDQAGRLEASEGETPRTVRRRLGDAGRQGARHQEGRGGDLFLYQGKAAWEAPKQLIRASRPLASGRRQRYVSYKSHTRFTPPLSFDRPNH